MKRYNNLDFCKSFAAILIVFHHYQQEAGVIFSGINFFEGNFYFGYLVELFFMISGFLMAVSNKGGKTILQKLKGKIIRIYPGAMLACSASLLVVYAGFYLTGDWVDKSVEYTNVLTIISSYLLIFSGWFFDIGLGVNNPTWYLCVLLLCYIIFYVAEWVEKKFSISKHIIFICVILVSFCGMYFNKDLPWFFTSQNQRGYTCFFIGVLLYDYFVKRLSDYMKKTMLVVLFILYVVGVWYRGINSWEILSIFVYPAILCLLVYIKQLPDKYAILGTTSYEVYLWH